MDRAHITDDFIIQSPLPEIDIPLCDLWSSLYKSCVKYEDKVAFMDPVTSRSLSYKEVLEATDVIARNLLANGFSGEKILTICMTNCLDYLLILLSGVRIGAKCANLPAYLKEGEMQPLITQLNTEFIVTNRKTVDVVKSATSDMKGIKIISDVPGHSYLSLSDLFTRTEKTDKINVQLPKHNPTTDTCLISFSSGTTGNHKPVEVTHSFVIQQIYAYSYALDLATLESGALLYQPLSHPWTYILWLCHFFNGHRTLIMPEPDMKRYVSLASEYKIERLYITPPAAVFLCKSGISKQYPLSHVTYIQSAAAILKSDLEDELVQACGHNTRISQMFGCNEIGVGLVVPMKADVHCSPGSVGWPVCNLTAKIIDSDTGANVGPNKQGELCLKSPYPMKGYMGHIELTAQTFDSEGFCKTGDLGYYDEKGCIFIVDRLKEVINVGGSKVPPAFLESLLLTHPHVADAGVTSVPDLEYVEVPYAWVVIKPGIDVTEDELHAFVNVKVNDRRRIRGGIKFVEAIPKSPSGKILRRIMKEQSRSEIIN